MRHFLAACVLCMLMCHALIWAQTDLEGLSEALDNNSPDSLAAVKEDSLFYAADSMAYDQDTEQIKLFGSTSVEYQSFKISSDSLMIDLNKKRAYSFGDTVMQDGEQILLGADVAYDIDTQTGIMSGGSSKLEGGYYSGDDIRKIGEDIYDVDNGVFTTCDHADPEFWFSASQLRIYRGDKIVGRPVVAYVNHLPVFYFPFITIPLQKGRRAGFLIPEPGYNSVDGMFIRDISWYYPYKDYADVILSLDLMEKTGWKTKLSVDYLRRYMLNGSFDAAYQKKISGGQTYYDWSLRANHHQDFADKATFDVNLDFVSNKRVWDTSDVLDESLAQSVTSSISYRKPLLGSYLNVGASYTEDLINDRVSISLPSASLSLPSRPVYELFYKPERSPEAWWSNINYNYNVRLDHTGSVNNPDREFQDLIWSNVPDPADSTSFLSQHNLGVKHHIGLAYNWKLRGWLNFQHGLIYNEAWFDRDRNDNRLVRGNDYNAYTNASFNIYGIRNFRAGWLKSLRHILSPSVGLSFNPDFRDNSRFFSFGGISLSSADRAANLNLSLDQKVQIKYGEQNAKINDLINLTSRISANLNKEEKPFGALSHSASFRPGNISLGNFRLPGTNLRLDKIVLGYSSQYTLAHDPYALHWTDWKPNSQYFTHSLSLSGSAPYRNYFPKEKNRLFDPYQTVDSLQTQAEQAAAQNKQENWKISVSHDLQAKSSLLDPASSNLRFDAAFNLTTNWSLTYGAYYDLKNSDLISQTVRIIRDLHCWKLDISYTKRNDYWEYRIALFNTSLPDALRFQTRDSGRD